MSGLQLRIFLSSYYNYSLLLVCYIYALTKLLRPYTLLVLVTVFLQFAKAVQISEPLNPCDVIILQVEMSDMPARHEATDIRYVIVIEVEH